VIDPSVTASPACRRCGQCCLKGGPALHREDLPLLLHGGVLRAHLVTLRRGETVHENVAGGLVRLVAEVVKIAGRGRGPACRFYDRPTQSCQIHPSRPAECRSLICEDTSAIEDLYQRDRLTRADILAPGGGLWELVAYHDRTFPADMASDLARQAAVGRDEPLESLVELSRAEESFRRAFMEKTGIDALELDFYFGRSLSRVCAPFGVRLSD
jgi:Fe-S-cluster containining protein